MLFFLLINVKMPTIVGILTFMSRNKKIMLSRAVHDISFLTSGPVLVISRAECIKFCMCLLLLIGIRRRHLE